MQDARSVASASIAKTFKRFPELDPSSIDAADLEPRDASLARAIDHSVRRRWLTLAAMIEHASNRPFVTLEPTVGASLLVGTSQLLLFDRLPDHAVIDCAVEWTRHGGKRPRATGFVNAVLRKVVKLRGSLEETGELGNEKHLPRSDGSWWHLTEDVFKSVAPQVGFSKKVWARVEKQLGAQIAQTFALNAIAEPPLIVRGETLPQSVTPHETPKFGVLPSGAEIQPFLKESPQLQVQDPTSGVSLTLLRSIEQTPHRI